MTVKSNVLIIGSTGRNIGKTEFACRIIEKHSSQNEIVAVKVVPVDKDEFNCHRGTDTCGLCNSLKTDYKIIEEKIGDTSKDTSRMLNAGAKKVYLLLVETNSLKKGINALLDTLPYNTFVVIESNSIRKVLEPGLFIVINKLDEDFVKPTCADVIDLADKIIGFSNMNWDFNPNNILIKNGDWVIAE